jgi:hypothetical protein
MLDNLVEGFVLPIALVEQPGSPASRIHSITGTGFLVDGGRGLGVTARHVAKDTLEATKAGSLYAYAIYRLCQPENYRAFRILRFEHHASEDVALFRLPDDDFHSPYKLSSATAHAGTETMLWGYPDEIRHDYTDEGLIVDLVYSAGHVRRRIDRPLPLIPGEHFLELSSPAGSCCSGSPVSLRPSIGIHGKQVVGIYVGERRNEANTFAVGYATRAEALTDQWPQLFEDNAGRLAELCAPT